MSLQDKLNENRNMSELFQETKELNELMKSYIRDHMNEEMAKEVTIHNQLNQIQSKSDKDMSNMQSILNKQETMLQENAENLQAILINEHKEIETNPIEIRQRQEQQAIHIEKERNNVARKRREYASDFDKWKRGNGKEQQQDGKSSVRDAKIERGGIESDKQRNKHEHDEHKEKSQRNSQKSRARDEGLSLYCKTWGTRDKYYRRYKIWCCYKCDYYSSSLFSSFLTKRDYLYGFLFSLQAND